MVFHCVLRCSVEVFGSNILPSTLVHFHKMNYNFDPRFTNMAVNDDVPPYLRNIWPPLPPGSPGSSSSDSSTLLGGSVTYNRVDVLGDSSRLHGLVGAANVALGGVDHNHGGDVTRDFTAYQVSRQVESLYHRYMSQLLSDLNVDPLSTGDSYRALLLRYGTITAILEQLLGLCDDLGGVISEFRFRLIGLQQKLIVHDVQHLCRKKSTLEILKKDDESD